MSPDSKPAKLPPSDFTIPVSSTEDATERVGSNQFLPFGSNLRIGAPVVEGPRASNWLPKDFKPDKWSVICGRGKVPQLHVGNRRLQVLVDCHANTYDRAKSKSIKSTVVSQIVETIRSGSKIGGFVKKDHKTGRWYEVGDEAAREKVGSALRDCIAGKNPSKYKTKTKRRQSDPPRQIENTTQPQRTKSLPLSHTAKAHAKVEKPAAVPIHAPSQIVHPSAAIASETTTLAAPTAGSASILTTPNQDNIQSDECEPGDIVHEQHETDDFYEYCFGGSKSI